MTQAADLTLHQRRRKPTFVDLQGIPWLALLGPDERARAVESLQVSDAQAGDFVCRVGKPVTYWFGVIEGLLKMSADNAQGLTMTFAGVPPGGWFGEGTALKREPTATTSRRCAKAWWPACRLKVFIGCLTIPSASTDL